MNHFGSSSMLSHLGPVSTGVVLPPAAMMNYSSTMTPGMGGGAASMLPVATPGGMMPHMAMSVGALGLPAGATLQAMSMGGLPPGVGMRGGGDMQHAFTSSASGFPLSTGLKTENNLQTSPGGGTPGLSTLGPQGSAGGASIGKAGVSYNGTVSGAGSGVAHNLTAKKKKKQSKSKVTPASSTPTTSSIPEDTKPVSFTSRPEEGDLDSFLSYQRLCNTHMDLKAKLHLLYNSRHACQLCQREFKGFCRLKRHLQTHASFKPYRCDVCDRRFYNVSKLKRHSLVHSGLKPYKCPICDSALSRREHLKRHMLTHSEERPYHCDVCDYSSRRLDGVHKHIRSKHLGEGARPTYVRPQVFDLLAASIPMYGKEEDDDLSGDLSDDSSDDSDSSMSSGSDYKDPLADKSFLQMMMCNVKYSAQLVESPSSHNNAKGNVTAGGMPGRPEKKKQKKKAKLRVKSVGSADASMGSPRVFAAQPQLADAKDSSLTRAGGGVSQARSSSAHNTSSGCDTPRAMEGAGAPSPRGSNAHPPARRREQGMDPKGKGSDRTPEHTSQNNGHHSNNNNNTGMQERPQQDPHQVSSPMALHHQHQQQQQQHQQQQQQQSYHYNSSGSAVSDVTAMGHQLYTSSGHLPPTPLSPTGTEQTLHHYPHTHHHHPHPYHSFNMHMPPAVSSSSSAFQSVYAGGTYEPVGGHSSSAAKSAYFGALSQAHGGAAYGETVGDPFAGVSSVPGMPPFFRRRISQGCRQLNEMASVASLHDIKQKPSHYDRH